MADETGAVFPDAIEPHQVKLKSFIADIPPLGGQEIKSGSPAFPTPFTKAQLDALQGIKSDPLFNKYTGYEHKSLLEKWLVNRTTTCNEFCSRCAIAMGYTAKEGVGRFDIADWLNSRGLGHVWVPAESGSKPEYGDIFRLYSPEPDHNGVRLNHMAVSLHVAGRDWYTVESGQGGPSKGYDAIVRKKREWMPTALRGWVSMKALLNAEKPLPYWLGGWWKVEEEPYDTYWYHFGANGKVTYVTKPPVSVTGLPVPPCTTGTFRLKGMFGLEISWNSADFDETFTIIVQEQKARRYRMTGKTARGVELTATRLMTKDAFS